MVEISGRGYNVAVDVKRRIVKIVLLGFWTLDTFEEYSRAIGGLAARGQGAGRERSEYRVLIDLRQHGIQSKDVAEKIEKGITNAATNGQRHAVLISSSALYRAQMRRIGAYLQPRFFEHEQDALDWLLADSGRNAQ